MANKLEGLSEVVNAEIKSRINLVLNERGLTNTAFSKHFGCSQKDQQNIQKKLSSQLSDDVEKPANVSLDVVMLILSQYPEISADWLLRGWEPQAVHSQSSVISPIGGNSINNNNNTTVNDTEAVRYIVKQLEEKDRQLEEKDKQIDRLMQLMERQKVG